MTVPFVPVGHTQELLSLRSLLTEDRTTTAFSFWRQPEFQPGRDLADQCRLAYFGTDVTNTCFIPACPVPIQPTLGMSEV